MNILQCVLLGMYLFFSAALAAYAMHGLWLLRLWSRRVGTVRRNQEQAIAQYWIAAEHPDSLCTHYPGVTVQLPLYNEAEVATRLIDSVAALDYPCSRLSIQILDDSNDDSGRFIDTRVAYWSNRGVNIGVIRRSSREGYKAGALAIGLQTAKHDLIAIFDADFVPPRDFLRRAVPLMMQSEDIACVQGRWEHLNQNQNWLTRAQSIGIDGHFAIEQGARAWNGLYMNFNGTAALWRREAILAAGGWQADTLTEDLDLSYRAQMAGYRIIYALDMVCPAEVPATADALKSQQRRWATGSIQTTRKLLRRIWQTPGPWRKKIAATFHLTHYCVCLCMAALALLTWPVLTLVPFAQNGWLLMAWCVILLSALAPCLSYYVAGRVLGHARFTLRNIPGLIVLGSGLALNNALAVLTGICRGGGEFVRTPKTGTTNATGQQVPGGRYRAPATRFWWAEIGLSAYCACVLIFHVRPERWLVGVFLVFYAIGLGRLGWASRPPWLLRITPRRVSNAKSFVSAKR